MPERLLTVREAAAKVNRTESALRYQIHTGNAPRSALIMGRRMFRESDVDAWIVAQFDADASAKSA